MDLITGLARLNRYHRSHQDVDEWMPLARTETARSLYGPRKSRKRRVEHPRAKAGCDLEGPLGAQRKGAGCLGVIVLERGTVAALGSEVEKGVSDTQWSENGRNWTQ